MNLNNSRNDARQNLKITFRDTDYQILPKHMQKQPFKTASRNIWAKQTPKIQISNPSNNKEHIRKETKRKIIKQLLLYEIIKNRMRLPARINIFNFKATIKPTVED